jgi:hypothetical protein
MVEVFESIELLTRIYAFLQTTGLLEWAFSITALGVCTHSIIYFWKKANKILGKEGKSYAYSSRRYYSTRHH